MRFFLALFLAALVLLIGIQGYRLFTQAQDLTDQGAALRQDVTTISTENATIARDIRFYQNPINATKELQSKSNYHKPGEQMLILVPAESGQPAENTTH